MFVGTPPIGDISRGIIAFSMTAVELAKYRAFWRERSRTKPTPEMRAAAEAARLEAQRLSQILAAEFGVERVYLFGSFAWGPEIRPDSDLDLAAEGLSPDKLLPASGRLERASRYALDLLRLERLPGPLRNLILQSGLVVYGDHHEHHGVPMNPSPSQLLTTSLRNEIEKLRQVQGEVAADWASFADRALMSTHDLRGIASALTDIYQGAENAFQRIARATGEGLPSGAEWHRELLDQMSREVSGVRPAVIGAETRVALEPFRDFRHRARHLYGFDLEWGKTRPLLEVAENVVAALVADLELFCAALEQMADDA